VAQIFQRSGTLEVSFKDSGIESVEDMRGKRVGVWDFGNEHEVFAALRQAGIYQVLTPPQCIELASALGDDGLLFFQPLLGGLSPDVGWQSLELLADRVLPALQ